MKPIFKTSKRSYLHIKLNQHMDIGTGPEPLNNRDLKAVDDASEMTMKVSVSNKYMQDTVRSSQAQGFADVEESKIDTRTDTFQSQHQTDHKFQPQYNLEGKSVREGTQHPFNPKISRKDQRAVGTDAPQLSQVKGSHQALVRNQESFGIIQNMVATHQKLQTPLNNNSTYMTAISRHFNMTSPLVSTKNGSQTPGAETNYTIPKQQQNSRWKNSSQRPKRMNVFVRSGHEDGHGPPQIQTMSPWESQTVNYSPRLTDIVSATAREQHHHQMIINEGPFTQKLGGLMDGELVVGASLGTSGQSKGVLYRNNGPSQSTVANHHSYQRRGKVIVTADALANQVISPNVRNAPSPAFEHGIRHAIALEKLVSSQDGTESARQGQNKTDRSQNDKYDLQLTFKSIQTRGATSTTHRSGAGNLFQKRGQTIAVVHHQDPAKKVETNGKDSSPITKPVITFNSSQRKGSLQPIMLAKARELDHSRLCNKPELSPYRDYPKIAQKIFERNSNSKRNIESALGEWKTGQQSSTSTNMTQFNLQNQQAQLQHMLAFNAPSQSHFIAHHLGQTVNSIRRQGRVTLKKNRARYDQEDQVKQLMRNIKKTRLSLVKKANSNAKARDALMEELAQQVRLQQNQSNTTIVNYSITNEQPGGTADTDIKTLGTAGNVYEQVNTPSLPLKTNVSHADTQAANQVSDNFLATNLSFPVALQQKSMSMMPNTATDQDHRTTVGSLWPQTQRSCQQQRSVDEDAESRRIHMLYKGSIQIDVEKRMKLTKIHLEQTKTQTEKHLSGAESLKKENAALREKIKLYERLIDEHKVSLIQQAEAGKVQAEEVIDLSVTRKLGLTDIGDVSDILEIGSTHLNKSQDDNWISKIQMEKFAGQAHSMIHILRQEDINESKNLIGVNQIDSEKSHALETGKIKANINHSSSLETTPVFKNKKVVNNEASINLKDAMNEMRNGQTQQDKKRLRGNINNLDSGISGADVIHLRTDSDDNSIEYASKVAVQKYPLSHNIDTTRLKHLTDKMSITLRQDKCIDVVIHFLDDLCKVCGFQKATMFFLDYVMKSTIKKGVTKDKMKYCNSVNFKDQKAGTSKIIGVASVGQLCQKIAFQSILDDPEAPGLLPWQAEDTLIISLQDHKICILVRNEEGQSRLMLQMELGLQKAKKKPLNMGDVNLLKLVTMIIYERLQKFKILAQLGNEQQSLGDVIKFVLRTARKESHKELGRSLEEDLPKLEGCQNVNVLFLDRSTQQLYTIVYTEDDDYQNTMAVEQQQVEIQLNRTRKYNKYKFNGSHQNRNEVEALEERLNKMQSELEVDMGIRSLILSRNQMICIPSDQGLTGVSFCKAKTIYYNNFEGVTQSSFYPESDNLKSYKNIKNFMMAPILGHDGKPNGLLQFYSFNQAISRLQVKKMIALRKFIGGCLENVGLNSNNLESIVGVMGKLDCSAQALVAHEHESEIQYRQILELESNVKTVRKDINNWYSRATTEPGFMQEVTESTEGQKQPAAPTIPNNSTTA